MGWFWGQGAFQGGESHAELHMCRDNRSAIYGVPQPWDTPLVYVTGLATFLRHAMVGVLSLHTLNHPR